MEAKGLNDPARIDFQYRLFNINIDLINWYC